MDDELIRNDTDLDAIDHLMMREMLVHPTATDQDLADKLGLSRVQISRRKNSERFKIQLGKLLSIDAAELKTILVKAIRVHEAAMSCGNLKIAMAAASSLLRVFSGADKNNTTKSLTEAPDANGTSGNFPCTIDQAMEMALRDPVMRFKLKRRLNEMT